MNKVLAIALLASLTVTAQAGVKETKAKRAAEQKISEAVTGMQAACGNAQLEAGVNWDSVDAMISGNTAVIEDKGSRTDWIYSQVGDRTASTAEALAKICSDDEDYKAEIAKITNISVTAKEKYDDYKSAFELDGTTLNVQNGWYMTRSASDFTTRLLNLF